MHENLPEDDGMLRRVRRLQWRGSRLAALSLLVFAGADLLSPFLTEIGPETRLAYLVLVTIPLMTLPVYAAAPAHRFGPRLLLATFAALAVVLLAPRLGDPGTAASVGKLVAAASIGFVLARMLKKPVEAIVVAIMVAGIDIYSVANGPTRAMVSVDQGLLDDFALNLRVPGMDFVDQIGTSDVVFLGFFAVVSLRFGLRYRATCAAMTASVGLSMLLAHAMERPVPALPLLSTAFLAVNFDRFRTAGERLRSQA